MNRVDPIFIVGAPRSGTTLLREMLNRHPRIGLCDETFFFYYVYSRRRNFGDLGDPENRRLVVTRYLATERARRLGLDPDAVSETLLREGKDYPALFVSLLRSYARAQGKLRYGEKTPQHALEVETLCELFPDCRVIHLVRDPRAVVGSLMRMPWGAGSVAGNARVWRDCVVAAERSRGRDNFLALRYEDLVVRPEAELGRLCEFLGEPFAPEMLVADPGRQADRWWFQRAQGSLTQERVEKWREQMRPEQVAVVEWITMPWLAELGYAPVGRKASPVARLGALASGGLLAVWHRLKRLPRLWYTWFRPTELASEEAWIDRA